MSMPLVCQGAEPRGSDDKALGSNTMGVIIWLIVVVIVLIVVAVAFVIARRKRRGGGVIATRGKR